ncbi:SMP-30/gluconolactonase/LRE family protein (plasmid) [Roseomonas sp. OT10]|uniref:SMP-30/gluconolactonase/LRE family protein n=1 Tax=Roseomonas cutis TaxID=2897332 RepID=UPI001E31EF5A|nr:SMP-30/gluconolactonase/LRE family protein [Roseomonas sp. OT10]UFN51557.1 SMP-30/gluconolactonase/LRE family protein [Roseomonas sp. OT10]
MRRRRPERGRYLGSALLTACLALGPPAVAAERLGPAAESAVPVPPAERALPTILADRPVTVPGAKLDLEGPVFERTGGLIFSDVQGGRVLRLDRSGRIASISKLDGLMPGGMAIARDGRIFIAAGNGKGGGAIVAMEPDGTSLRTVLPEDAGFFPNDLIFDAAGGFYFTDARGTVGDPAGGVWYVPPGGGPPVPIVRNLAVANGIALSPDGKRLWVGEYALGRLYRLDLVGATAVAPFGAAVTYHFTGPAPDSMRVDSEGRVYVALYGQGRILIFSREGLPIRQVLLPGRDAGRNLHVTSMAIRPGSRDMVIVTSDGAPNGGARIFHARAPGSGMASAPP